MTLKDVLADQLSPASTRKEWCEILDTDSGALSRLLNGQMHMTQARAERWASKAHGDDFAKAAAFITALMDSAGSATKTIDDLFADVRSGRGYADAVLIGDIFIALAREKNSIAIVEYRDSPRAGPGGPYEAEARRLAEAIANGLTYVMFQPFSTDPVPHPADLTEADLEKNPARPVPLGSSGRFMNAVRAECRRFYKVIRHAAIAHKIGPDTDEAAARAEIDGRLHLYERSSNSFNGYGPFGSKVFVVQWQTDGRNQGGLFEWVSTDVAADLLIMRENTLNVDAVKDNFYPVAHHWDRLIWEEKDPALPDDLQAAHEGIVTAQSVTPPRNLELWQKFEPEPPPRLPSTD